MTKIRNPLPPPVNPNTPSTSREATVKTLQSSSAGAPEVLAASSKQSLNSELLPTPTASIPTSLPAIKSAAKVVPTEEDRKHAMFLKVAAAVLEHRGLCRREKVLAKDGSGKVLAIRLVFDPVLWTEQLELL